MSLVVFTFTVIGGLGGLAGPALGFVYYGLVSLLAADAGLQQVAAGLPGLFLLLWVPGGLAQGLQDVRDAMLRRVAARYRIVVPSLAGDQRERSDRRARVLDNVLPGGRPVHVPTVYEPAGQWSLGRYGTEGRVPETSRG
jgi:hypothetical protein